MWRCLRSTVHGSDLASISWRFKRGVAFSSAWPEYSVPRPGTVTTAVFVNTWTTSSNAPVPVVDAPDVQIPFEVSPSNQHNRENALALRRLLSSQVPFDITSTPHTLATFQASYRQAFLTGHLYLLKSSHLTNLIQLFGSMLSDAQVPHPPFAQVHAAPDSRTLQIQVAGPTVADFVIEVTRDKELSGRRLSDSDRYWVMRAALFLLSRSQTPAQNASLLELANRHYTYIWMRGPYTALHEPFLRGLMEYGSPSTSSIAFHAVHRILDKYNMIKGPRLVERIWKVILTGHSVFSLDEKAMLVTCLRNRISRHSVSNGVIPNHGEYQLSTLLATRIFPTASVLSPGSGSSAIEWAVTAAQSALSPSLPLSIRWRNVMLAALSQVPDDSAWLHLEDTGGIADHHLHQDQSRKWFTVFALALLQRESEGSVVVPPEFRQVVRSLWRVWKDQDDHSSEPKVVLRSTVQSFLVLSGRTLDALLLEGCFRFGVTHGLVQISTADSTDAVGAFLGQYISSWTACHGRSLSSFGQAFDAAVHAGGGSLSSTEVAEIITQSYLRRRSADLPHWYHFLQAEGVVLSSDLLTSLGTTFAPNRLDWTMSIMARELATDRRRRLALAVCHALRVKRLQTMHRRWCFTLAKALNETLEVDTHILKFDIRYAMEFLVNNGQARLCVPAILAIHRGHPGIFSWPYCIRLLSTLFRQRRNKLAVQLVGLASHWDERKRSAFRRKAFVGLSKSERSGRTAHFDKAAQIYRSQGTTERVIRASYQRRPNLAMLLLSLGQNPSVGALTTAFRILAYGHRPVAARVLLSRFLPRFEKTMSQDQREQMVTTLGNIFLNRILRRRMVKKYNHSPQVHAKLLLGKFLVTKKWLRKKYGFQGDGVTLVLVMKAILAWKKGMIAGNVRVLFDQVLKRGWSLQGTGRIFFTNDEIPSGGLDALLGADEMKLSFQRHIAPMYRLFIRGLAMRGDVQGAAAISSLLKSERRHAFSVVRRRQLRRFRQPE